MINSESNQSVYVASLANVLQAAESLGADRDELLKKAAIDRASLSQPDNRVAVDQLFRLYETAERATDNPDIGLYSGRVAYISGLNLQLYMLSICDSFRDYLNLMPSVLKLRGDIGAVKMERDGVYIIMEWHPLLPATAASRYLSDTVLAASATMVNTICIKPIDIVKACFSYPEPRDLTMLVSVFGENISFNQPISCLFFHRASLNHKVARLDYELSEQFTYPMRKLFDGGDPADNFVIDLRQSIIRLLPTGDISIDTAAAELNVSRRTLQRRLSDRDTQFLQVLQQVRFELAVRYLSDSRLSITEIAFLLGYTDQGSFSGAFKSWQGVSPREYRQT